MNNNCSKLFATLLLLTIPHHLTAKKTGSKKVSLNSKSSSNRWVINKIIARVNGANVLKSDLEQPRIEKEGGKSSLQEIIIEELLFQKASEKHLLPSSTDVERQIVAFKMQNNISTISDTEFEAQLKESGFTVAAYKNQLARLLAIENVKRAEISEKIIVTSQEVEDYFQKNPQYTKETFHVKVATLSEQDAKNYKQLIASKKITWKDLGTIEKEDIDPRYAAVLSMKKGAISQPIQSNEKYVLVMLADKQEKRLQTLDERYGSLERMFHQQKRDKLLSSFQADLMSKSSIVYL